MKFFRTTLFWRSALLSLITVGAALILLVLIAIQRPEVIFNTQTLNRLTPRIHRLLDPELPLRWNGAGLKAESLSFYRKSLTFTAQRLCVAETAPTQAVSGCLLDFTLGMVVDFRTLPPVLERIQVLTASGGELRITETPTNSQTSDSTPSDTAWLENLKFGRIAVHLDRLQVDALNFTGTAEISQGTDGVLHAGIHSRGFDLKALLAGNWMNGNWSAVVSSRLSSESMAFPSGVPLREISTKSCRITLESRGSRASGRSVLKAECPVSARLAVRNIRGLQVPRSLEAKISTELKFNEKALFFPDYETLVGTSAQAKITRTWVRHGKREFLSAEAELSATWKGDLESLPGSLMGTLTDRPMIPTTRSLESRTGGESPRGSVRLRMNASLARFESLVELLQGSNIQIPAPFHVLRGNLGATLDTEIRLGQGISLPITLAADLRSNQQRLKFRSQSSLSLGPNNSFLDSDVTLEEVTLQLPWLKLEENVHYLPDARFAPKTAEKPPTPGQSRARYRVRIHTREGRPAALLTNLAGGPANLPVPVHVDLTWLDGAPTQGSLRIASFPVELFRRRGIVERLNVAIPTPPEEASIDASIRVEYADYTLKVLLIGDLDRPTVRLTSDPPLPEDQLYSVLLFGVPPEELDEEQGESVGGMKAAVADRAVNLASLYLLASTPIQSVGYDASRGVFTAKLRLGAGTSLNLTSATAGSAARVGIRKRLGKYWTLMTELHGSTLDESRTVSTFLEWRHRY